MAKGLENMKYYFFEESNVVISTNAQIQWLGAGWQNTAELCTAVQSQKAVCLFAEIGRITVFENTRLHY